MNKHSQLPWNNIEDEVIDYESGRVGYCISRYKSRSEIIANAKFIVKAVNNYDTLVNLLRAIHPHIKEQYYKIYSEPIKQALKNCED